jgi:hypothetical protein
VNRTPHNLRAARGIITWALVGAAIWSTWVVLYITWAAKP